jgi:hypothetical protein
MRYQRPRLLGFICWILILGNLADLYRTMKQMGGPHFADSLEGFPYSSLDAEIILFATMGIFILCGILMYEGQGWARYLYFANMIPYLGHDYLAATHVHNSPFSMLIVQAKVVFVILSAVILFLPRVRRYFSPLYIDG